MKRYLNVVNGKLRVGKRPTKKTLGSVNVPNFKFEENIIIYVYKEFEQAGLIKWIDKPAYENDIYGRPAQGYWLETDKGYKRILDNYTRARN